jgi:hypothetical protein
MQKRSRSSMHLAYTHADLNRGWHEECFYIRNPAGAPFSTFTGARPVKQNSWTWGPPTPEKGRVALLEGAVEAHHGGGTRRGEAL